MTPHVLQRYKKRTKTPLLGASGGGSAVTHTAPPHPPNSGSNGSIGKLTENWADSCQTQMAATSPPERIHPLLGNVSLSGQPISIDLPCADLMAQPTASQEVVSRLSHGAVVGFS
jgi:hypothetical protein